MQFVLMTASDNPPHFKDGCPAEFLSALNLPEHPRPYAFAEGFVVTIDSLEQLMALIFYVDHSVIVYGPGRYGDNDLPSLIIYDGYIE